MTAHIDFRLRPRPSVAGAPTPSLGGRGWRRAGPAHPQPAGPARNAHSP